MRWSHDARPPPPTAAIGGAPHGGAAQGRLLQNGGHFFLSFLCGVCPAAYRGRRIVAPRRHNLSSPRHTLPSELTPSYAFRLLPRSRLLSTSKRQVIYTSPDICYVELVFFAYYMVVHVSFLPFGFLLLDA